MNRPFLLILAVIVTSGCFVGLSPVDVQTLLSRALTLERENGRLQTENCELRSRVGNLTSLPTGPTAATLLITIPQDTDGGLPSPRDGGRSNDR